MTLSVLCTLLPYLVIFFTYFGIAWKLHRAYQSIKSNDFQYANVERRITLVSKVCVCLTLTFISLSSPISR